MKTYLLSLYIMRFPVIIIKNPAIIHLDKSFATKPLFNNQIVRKETNQHPSRFPKISIFEGVKQNISVPSFMTNNYHYN